MEKLTKRKQQAINTKNKIYDTAVRLLKEGRFNHIKVDDICKEAQVSIGSFYNSFSSKNDIFIEIYRVADEYFLNAVKKALESGNTIERIIRYFDIYSEYNLHQGVDFVKNLYHVNNYLFISKGRPMQNVLLDLIAEGQRSGDLKNTASPGEIVEFLFVCARGVVYDWCLHNGDYDLTERMNTYISRLLMPFDGRQ